MPWTGYFSVTRLRTLMPKVDIVMARTTMSLNTTLDSAKTFKE